MTPILVAAAEGGSGSRAPQLWKSRRLEQTVACKKKLSLRCKSGHVAPSDSLARCQSTAVDLAPLPSHPQSSLLVWGSFQGAHSKGPKFRAARGREPGGDRRGPALDRGAWGAPSMAPRSKAG